MLNEEGIKKSAAHLLRRSLPPAAAERVRIQVLNLTTPFLSRAERSDME
jgi:hypothetical protein